MWHTVLPKSQHAYQALTFLLGPDWSQSNHLCFSARSCLWFKPKEVDYFLLISSLEADDNGKSHFLWIFQMFCVGPPQSFVTSGVWSLGSPKGPRTWTFLASSSFWRLLAFLGLRPHHSYYTCLGGHMPSPLLSKISLFLPLRRTSVIACRA